MIRPRSQEYLVETILKGISDVVSSLDDFQTVVNSLARMVPEMLHVRTCSLMMLDQETAELRIRASSGVDAEAVRNYRGRPGEGIAGWVVLHGRPLLITDVESHPLFRRKSLAKYSTRSLLSVPLMCHESVRGALNVNNKEGGEIFTRSDELLLTVVANFVAIAIEKAQMREVALQKERLDAELSIASGIQQGILPRVLPSVEGYEFAARCLPALEVAGDFYDILSLPGGKLCFVIGDVCGKGIPAALYMARVMSYFRAIAHVTGTADQLMAAVNGLLVDEWSDRTFVTACLAVLDPERNVVSVSSAGHQPPYWLRANAAELGPVVSEEGFPLGVVADAQFSVREVSLEAQDSLILYTDGITEAWSPGDECFGESRLEETLRRHKGTGDGLMETVLSSVADFAQARAQSDDQTVVVLRRT